MNDMRDLLNLIGGRAESVVTPGTVSSERPLALMSVLQRLTEKAPPGKKAERFIRKHKAEFKKRYGDAWEEVLYGTAWKNFGKRGKRS